MKISITKIKNKGLILLFWMSLWQISFLIVKNSTLLPSPIETFFKSKEILTNFSFYKDAFFTILRVFKGLLFSFTISLGFAFFSYYKKFIKELIYPFLLALKATPVMAIVILALLWFDSDSVSIFTSFLICFPIFYTNFLSSLERFDPLIIEMAKFYKVSKLKIFKEVFIKGLRPVIFTSIELCVALSFKSTIVAEVLSNPKYSIGYHLLNAKVFLETDLLFAWCFFIILLSFLIQKFVLILLSKIWKGYCEND